MYHNKGDFRNSEGRRLALVRRLRELTQKEVAYRAGLSASYISNLELGKCTLANPEPLSRALGVSTEYIMKGGDLLLEKW